jgi:AcrR family transcriptional regulator
MGRSARLTAVDSRGRASIGIVSASITRRPQSTSRTTPPAIRGGLRERKKRQPRVAISETATELFARQGFEQTTIADVAREAGVAKMTVTNYFALKEDLVFDRRAEIIDRLASAVRARETGPPSRPVLDAVRAVFERGLNERDPTYGFLGPRFAEMVRSSPALVAVPVMSR